MRRILVTVLAILAVASAAAQAAGLVATRSVEAAPVVAVQSTPVADVVLLGAGLEAGLRQGMVLSVVRARVQIAEIVLVDLRPRASAALITQLTSGQSIRTGDTASVKIVKV